MPRTSSCAKSIWKPWEWPGTRLRRSSSYSNNHVGVCYYRAKFCKHAAMMVAVTHDQVLTACACRSFAASVASASPFSTLDALILHARDVWYTQVRRPCSTLTSYSFPQVWRLCRPQQGRAGSCSCQRHRRRPQGALGSVLSTTRLDLYHLRPWQARR